MDSNKVVQPWQRHTNNVDILNNVTTKEAIIDSEDYQDTDGLVTNKKDYSILTTSADCTSLLFFDPRKNVIGNVHSGWRGTLQKIAIEAINKMKEEYGCEPKDIICCICPSIRKCHFEVDENVKNMFAEEFAYDDIIEIGRKVDEIQKYNIDTVEINKMMLKEVGLKDENIIDSELCTVCNNNRFHSYRVDKPNYGLNAAIIGFTE